MNQPERVISAALDRVWPGVVAGAALTVLSTSAVGINLWFASGIAADILTLIYVVVMAALVGAPDELGLHRAAIVLSALFWGGRAGGFAELVITQGRFDLWGAVAERGAIFAAVLTLHLVAARRIGHTQALEAHGIRMGGADRG